VRLVGLSACKKPGDLTQYYGSPEPATLTIEGRAYESAIGTTSWRVIMPDGRTGEVIGDAFAIITPAEPITAASPFTVKLELPLPFPPARLIYDLTAFAEDGKEPGSTADISRWQPQAAEQFSLPLLSRQELTLAPASGLYVLHIFVEWEDLGYVSCGFLLKVEE